MIQVNGKSFDDVFAMTFDTYFLPTDEYINNPGMGFVGYAHSDHMNQDNDTNRLEYTCPTDYDLERLIALPYCDNIYIRVEWRDLQHKEGVLEPFELWDRAINLCRKHGKRWSFRVMNTCTGTRYENSYPEFLQDKLKFRIVNNHEVPDGNHKVWYAEYDETYFKYWRQLMELLAERYDDDPLLEFVDISGYGLWGEFHHSVSHNEVTKSSDGEAIKQLIDIHMDTMKKTPAVSMMNVAWDPTIDEWMNEAQLHAFNRGAWIRRDMFYPYYSSFEYDIAKQVEAHGGALIFESGHYPDVTRTHMFDVSPMPYKDIFQLMLYYNSNYMGLGFSPWQAFRTTEGYYNELADASKSIGYRIYPTVVRTINNSVDKQRINIAFKNDGVAYPPGDLELTLSFKNGIVIQHTLPAGSLAPGQMSFFDITYPNEPNVHFEDGKPIKGNYFLLSAELKMREKRFPVEWAVKKTSPDMDRKNLKVILPHVAK